uniref:Uncharacterized protein n=1 Tax=Salix viminalis TaxID=40686 RepID=A0A6N2L702_SALVM
MAPPQYYAQQPPPRQVGFLEGWYAFYIYLLYEFLQLSVAAASWMIVAVILQLYLSPNDACDYTAQRQSQRLDARYAVGRAGIANTLAQARQMNVTSMLLKQRFCSNGLSRFGGEVSIGCGFSNQFVLQQLRSGVDSNHLSSKTETRLPWPFLEIKHLNQADIIISRQQKDAFNACACARISLSRMNCG